LGVKYGSLRTLLNRLGLSFRQLINELRLTGYRGYIQEHRQVTPDNLAEAWGVSQHTAERFLRQYRNTNAPKLPNPPRDLGAAAYKPDVSDEKKADSYSAAAPSRDRDALADKLLERLFSELYAPPPFNRWTRHVTTLALQGGMYRLLRLKLWALDPARDPMVRKFLTEIDHSVLSHYTQRNDIEALTLPKTGHWLAYELMEYTPDEPLLLKQVAWLSRCSPEGSALYFGMLGPHLRREASESDAVDFELAALLAPGFLPLLLELLNNSSRQQEAKDFAAVFINGLMVRTRQEAGQPLNFNLLRYQKKYLQRLEKALKTYGLPPLTEILGHIALHFPDLLYAKEPPNFMYFNNELLGNSEIRTLWTYNEKRQMAGKPVVSAWDLVTGHKASLSYRRREGRPLDDSEKEYLRSVYRYLGSLAGVPMRSQASVRGLDFRQPYRNSLFHTDISPVAAPNSRQKGKFAFAAPLGAVKIVLLTVLLSPIKHFSEIHIGLVTGIAFLAIMGILTWAAIGKVLQHNEFWKRLSHAAKFLLFTASFPTVYAVVIAGMKCLSGLPLGLFFLVTPVMWSGYLNTFHLICFFFVKYFTGAAPSNWQKSAQTLFQNLIALTEQDPLLNLLPHLGIKAASDFYSVDNGGKDYQDRTILFLPWMVKFEQVLTYDFIRRAIGFSYDDEIKKIAPDFSKNHPDFRAIKTFWGLYSAFETIRRRYLYPRMVPYILIHALLYAPRDLLYLLGLALVSPVRAFNICWKLLRVFIWRQSLPPSSVEQPPTGKAFTSPPHHLSTMDTPQPLLRAA
jgi:hypothetical protein